MKLEMFFEKFEQFADAPNAVAKMRELVLELAIQGKLIEQDSNDVSAIASLRKSTRAVRELEVHDDDTVPSGWASVPLGCVIASNTGGGTPSKQNSAYWNGSIPWASVKDIQTDKYLTTTIDSITEEGLKNSSSNLIPANRLIVVTRMGLGKLAINKIPTAINQDLRAIEPNEALDLDFAYLLFKALKMVGKGVTVKGIRIDVLHSMPVALPPLTEQKRIVAKVDELMALCDRLEAQQQVRDTRHAALARVSLARFAEAPTPANLDFLFHQSYTITPADLRKSILTLAVRGKLVPQDPIDEPALELIVRLSQGMCEEDRRRQAEPQPEIPSDLIQYELPESWTWARFRDVAIIASNLVKPNNFLDFVHLAPDNIEKGNGVLLPCATVREDKVISANHRFYPGQIVYSKIRPNLAKVVVVDFEGLCSADMYPINALIDTNFLHRYMLSETFLIQAVKTDTRVAMPKINQAELNAIAVPVPPLAEQRRIVAKFDQLMALVDQLETQLIEAKSKSAALLEAIVHELLNPTAEVIDLASYRAAIGCYTISKMSQQPYFGRTAAMKMLYLAEAHVGLNLGMQPEREAAGPFDHWIYRFEDEGKQKAWFKAVENTSNGKMKVEYQPGKMLAAQAALAESQLAQKQRKEFDRLLDLLSDKKTEEVEIIATLFAAWNDFLIDGHAPSDDEIVTEVRENWHERKERFTPAQLRQWLGWLRKNNLVPQGRQPRTVQQSKLLLN